MSWARLLKRVFDIDVQHCPNCGGTLNIIAARRDSYYSQNPQPTSVSPTSAHVRAAL
jgi:hypothetical protein